MESTRRGSRRLRQYGWERDRLSREPGTNSRLDELQATVLRVKLEALDADNDRRRTIAARYREALGATDLVRPCEATDARHVYHLYVVRSPERDLLAERLAERGIGSAIHYPVPVHRQPAYSARTPGRPLPVTERADAEVLSLPLFPELGEGEVEEVAGAVRASTGG